jgi:hypothetical protein
LASVLVVRVVPAQRREAREGGGREQRASRRGRAALIQPCAGEQNRAAAPPRGHQERALTALPALAAVLAALRAASRGGLDRLTRATDGTRCARTSRRHARLCAYRRAHRAPGAVVTPWGTGVIGRPLGAERVGQPLPWTPTARERPHRGEDVPPIDLARAPSSLARLSGGEPRFPQGPVLVRQSGWIPLAGRVFFAHHCALLCAWERRELSNKSGVLPSPISG